MPDGQVLTNVTGDIGILANTVSSLGTDLDCLESVGGEITIFTNQNLVSVDNFNQVTSLGDVTIGNNAALTEVTGFNSILEAGEIIVNNNANIERITGFSSLTTASKIFIGDGGNQIVSIAGFSSLVTVNGELRLEELSDLANLNELTSLTTVTGACTISPESLLDSAPQNVQEACGFVPPP